MAEVFLRAHYLFLLVVVFGTSYRLFNRDLGEPDYIWVLSLLPPDFFPPLFFGIFLFISAVFTTTLIAYAVAQHDLPLIDY